MRKSREKREEFSKKGYKQTSARGEKRSNRKVLGQEGHQKGLQTRIL